MNRNNFCKSKAEISKHHIMKKTPNYLLVAVCLAIGFTFGLAFEGLIGKTYAKTKTSPATKLVLPEDAVFESVATGTARSADYEIITVYGRKYIIFSNGDDIEVLNY